MPDREIFFMYRKSVVEGDRIPFAFNYKREKRLVWEDSAGEYVSKRMCAIKANQRSQGIKDKRI